LVVSAGSKMQAHLFAAYSVEGQIQLRHICKYNQQVFKPVSSVGRKEFQCATDTQDFRIMATSVV
jgi:hypothetical protein